MQWNDQLVCVWWLAARERDIPWCVRTVAVAGYPPGQIIRVIKAAISRLLHCLVCLTAQGASSSLRGLANNRNTSRTKKCWPGLQNCLFVRAYQSISTEMGTLKNTRQLLILSRLWRRAPFNTRSMYWKGRSCCRVPVWNWVWQNTLKSGLQGWPALESMF